jgi:ribosomal protein S18 acetylase RimI-like enzyme
LTVERVAEHDRRAVDLALGVLLRGVPEPRDGSVRDFRQYLQHQQGRLDNLWLARRHGLPSAAALVLRSPGRTGIVLQSPIRVQRQVEDASAALASAVIAARGGEIALLQALIDYAQVRELESLKRCGFRNLADLAYLRGPVRGPGPELGSGVGSGVGSGSDPGFSPPLPEGLRLWHYLPEHRPTFARAILASYEQTLDCPGLLGLRSIEDVIDGHLATGQFHPHLWWALTQGDAPVGVCLLSLAPSLSAAELVYLGLAPAWRRKGLARMLMKRAMAAAGAHGAERMLLAVDEANAPAMSLYRSLGFEATDRKLALILPLGPVSPSGPGAAAPTNS